MEYGIVYLLTNPVMPGLVKIGMTAQEDIDKRMKELYTTGVPVPFECQFACKVKKGDCAKIEKALHRAFSPQRINANREFFRIQVEQAKAILELFHHTDVTEEVSDEIENDLTDDDKAASEVTYRIVLLSDAVSRLTEYDPEFEPVAKAIESLKPLNAETVDQLKTQLAEAKDKIVEARNNLIK